jgi:hypothetical protein
LLSTIAIMLAVLWGLGMISGASMGWWIHIFLVLALVALILAVARRAPAV